MSKARPRRPVGPDSGGGAMISESQMILSGLLTRLELGPASLPGDGPAATTDRRAAAVTGQLCGRGGLSHRDIDSDSDCDSDGIGTPAQRGSSESDVRLS